MHVSYLTLEAPRNGQASYTHIHEIIGGLKRRGWEVSLYQPSYAMKKSSPGLFLRLMHSLMVQFQLWAGYKKGTVIYVRAHYLAFPTALIASAFNVPIIQEVNGPYEDTFVTHPSLNKVKPILIWMQKTQYRLATRLIGVTENIVEWLHRESRGKKAFLVPNGANTDLFKSNLPKPSGLPAKYAIFFGGLSRWHGIPDILAAMDHPDWPSDTDLVIIGDGAERALVENRAALNSRIHYLGKKDYTDIPAYVCAALCGLVPITNPQGRSETGLYPLKLFETLACGVPVIVTDFSGQADLVRGGECGLIINPDKADQIAKAVKIFAEDESLALKMGKNGEDLVRAEHSWDKRAADTHGILTKTLEE